MQVYRGIRVYDSVKLTNQDGSPKKRTMKVLDDLADRLEETGYKLKSPFKGVVHKMKARCNKGHDIMILHNDFVTKKAGCRKCFFESRYEGIIQEFNRICKRHQLKMLEPLDYSKGVYAGLKQEYEFECKNGHTLWFKPYGLVRDYHYQCFECERLKLKQHGEG